MLRARTPAPRDGATSAARASEGRITMQRDIDMGELCVDTQEVPQDQPSVAADGAASGAASPAGLPARTLPLRGGATSAAAAPEERVTMPRSPTPSSEADTQELPQWQPGPQRSLAAEGPTAAGGHAQQEELLDPRVVGGSRPRAGWASPPSGTRLRDTGRRLRDPVRSSQGEDSAGLTCTQAADRAAPEAARSRPSESTADAEAAASEADTQELPHGQPGPNCTLAAEGTAAADAGSAASAAASGHTQQGELTAPSVVGGSRPWAGFASPAPSTRHQDLGRPFRDSDPARSTYGEDSAELTYPPAADRALSEAAQSHPTEPIADDIEAAVRRDVSAWADAVAARPEDRHVPLEASLTRTSAPDPAETASDALAASVRLSTEEMHNALHVWLDCDAADAYRQREAQSAFTTAVAHLCRLVPSDQLLLRDAPAMQHFWRRYGQSGSRDSTGTILGIIAKVVHELDDQGEDEEETQVHADAAGDVSFSSSRTACPLLDGATCLSDDTQAPSQEDADEGSESPDVIVAAEDPAEPPALPPHLVEHLKTAQHLCAQLLRSQADAEGRTRDISATVATMQDQARRSQRAQEELNVAARAAYQEDRARYERSREKVAARRRELEDFAETARAKRRKFSQRVKLAVAEMKLHEEKLLESCERRHFVAESPPALEAALPKMDTGNRIAEQGDALLQHLKRAENLATPSG